MSGRSASRVGPYLIERRLGAGGMGVVYLGHHDVFGSAAAVKLLKPEFLADPQYRARLRRELDAARRVPRFCTAPVLGADLDAEPPWVATEYIDGPALDVVLLERGRLVGEALEAFAAGVAVALRSIHEHGVVHRDLKPSNVLITSLGPRVIDFGIARIEEESGTQPTQLTQAGAVVGTPAYMAPEQLRGEQASAAADVFAWANLVTYAATGRPPFGTGDAALPAILFEEPDLGGPDELPEPLRGLVTAAFAKDPVARPSASELVDRLSEDATDATTQVLEAATDAATVAATVVDRPAARGRRRWAMALAAAGLAAVVAATATLLSAGDAAGGSLVGESITIGAFHNWEEGIAATYLWKAALEGRGAEVEVEFANVSAVYQGVASGDYDLAFDAWLPDTHRRYWAILGNDLEDLGAWYAGEARLTIAVNDDAPIRSLDELAGAAGEFDNRLIGIEQGAGHTETTEQAVIPTYGLERMDFEVSSTDAMLAELQDAIDQGENAVVTLWEPHWAYQVLPIRNLADPERALGDPQQIRSFARPGFSDDFPQVAGWVQSFTMTDEELRSLESVMFHEHDTASEERYQEPVRQWLAERPGYLAQLTGGRGGS